jgi:hypothetical protein
VTVPSDRKEATLLPSECPNCGRLHHGHSFVTNPGPVQAVVERYENALRAIADENHPLFGIGSEMEYARAALAGTEESA